MSKKKYQKIRTKEQAISEAFRYLANAKETLSRIPIEHGKVYSDSKYVREASGIAYLAPLRAIDGYLLDKGTHPDKLPNSIDDYWDVLNKMDNSGVLKANLHVVYESLHLSAYYRGSIDVQMVKSGMQSAREIVNLLK